MDKRINQVAALANIEAYDSEATKKYIDGAPHIKHASLRELYGKLVVQIFDHAKKHTKYPNPRVLDLGAGEGSVTLPFLQLGAKVDAIDISESQLKKLKERCKKFDNMLEIHCKDINEALENKDEKYDIIVVNSFLHHVPDYLGLINECTNNLAPHGQFFSFQDPLRYDSLSQLTMTFSNFSYLLNPSAQNCLKTSLQSCSGSFLINSGLVLYEISKQIKVLFLG